MRGRSLIVLASVVAVLGALIVLVERHQPTSDERRARADRLFPDLEADRIVAIEVRSDDQEVRLVEQDGEWQLVEPIAYPADPAAVLGLLEAVAGLVAERVLGADEIEPGSYGLDDPIIEVELTDGDGRSTELEVGGTTPLGNRRAVHRGDAGDVVLCPGGFVSRLDLPVDDWRSREVVAVAEHELGAVAIEAGEDRIRAERADDRWWLVEPLADLADQNQIAQLVSELNGLRVTEFVSPGIEPAELGLDDPEFRIRLESEDAPDPITLELAAPKDDATTVICRRNGTDLFRVPDTLRLRLEKAPVLWRSKLVWPFSSWDASRAVFTGRSDVVEVEQVDGVWQLADGGEADAAAVRRRLGRLAELEVADHDLVLPPTEVLGSVELTLDGGAQPETRTFTFYSALEPGGNAAVTVTGRDNVMGVDAAVAETIVGDLASLRPREDAAAEQ